MCLIYSVLQHKYLSPLVFKELYLGSSTLVAKFRGYTFFGFDSWSRHVHKARFSCEVSRRKAYCAMPHFSLFAFASLSAIELMADRDKRKLTIIFIHSDAVTVLKFLAVNTDCNFYVSIFFNFLTFLQLLKYFWVTVY